RRYKRKTQRSSSRDDRGATHACARTVARLLLLQHGALLDSWYVTAEQGGVLRLSAHEETRLARRWALAAAALYSDK
ncbi:MAG: hypothetical protein ABEI52_11940, partial [Halobacteriaceae archaeon]